jgi:hypothetical protein
MRTVLTLGLAGLSFVATPMLAQSRAFSGRGTGSITLPSASAVPLYHFNFKQADRTVTLVFAGKNPAVPYTFEGRITSSSSSSDLRIELTGGLRDRNTRGTGRIRLSGLQLEAVDLDGSLPQGRFRLDFRGEEAGADTRPGNVNDDAWDNADDNLGARPLNLSVRGTGTYELSGRRTTLSEMRIRLRDNGEAELRFSGDRTDLDARGRWSRGFDGRAMIELTEWDGRRASGTAAVTYRGREIERVRVDVTDRNARVEFSPSRTRDEGGSGPRPINTSFTGSGTLRERGRNYQLDEVAIRLRDNGEAELRFRGDRSASGRGRWSRSGNSAALTIDEWDGRSTNGSGRIQFVGSQPRQVTVSLQGGRSVTFQSTLQAQPR